MLKRLFLAGFALMLVSATAAYADTLTFQLTQDACTGGCGTSPFGQVVLTQTSTNLVSGTVTLFNGNKFVNTGAGESLEFDVNGTSITVTSLTTGFTAGGAATASAFGSFDHSIACTGCGPGASSPLTGPINFTVSDSDGSVALADFVANSDGIYFTSDIIGNGNTGNVGANGPGTPGTPAVPEPSSLLLLGTGVLGVAGMLRRRFTA